MSAREPSARNKVSVGKQQGPSFDTKEVPRRKRSKVESEDWNEALDRLMEKAADSSEDKKVDSDESDVECKQYISNAF